jgi:hypothetical protein
MSKIPGFIEVEGCIEVERCIEVEGCIEVERCVFRIAGVRMGAEMRRSR